MWPCTRRDTMELYSIIALVWYNHINCFAKSISSLFISIVIIVTNCWKSLFACRFAVMCVHVVTLWTTQTFPEERLSVCWAVVITFNSDWHNCLRAMRAVMWLSGRVFNNHHNRLSIFTFPQNFCMLRCCIYINQNSRRACRRPHNPCT